LQFLIHSWHQHCFLLVAFSSNQAAATRRGKAGGATAHWEEKYNVAFCEVGDFAPCVAGIFAVCGCG
jgi:glutathione peroxidase-family protein